MRQVLFLGANHAQVPYLRAARSLGFRVVATDRRREAPGAALADAFHAVGYDDVEGLLRVASREGLEPGDRIFTAAAHLAFEGAAAVASRVGIPFPSPDAVATCLDKTRLYPALERLGVPHPRCHAFDPARPRVPDPRRVYYLKSDFGKSPRYCYRIAGGRIPELPRRPDAFYRRAFVLQEEVEGVHYRVNLLAGRVATFLKLSDRACIPQRVLGPGHREVVERLRAFTTAFGLDRLPTKFDLVVDDGGFHVLDVGLDPPLRLRLLCDHLGLDLPRALVRFALLGEADELPLWSAICRPVLIAGSPEAGFRVDDLLGGVPDGAASSVRARTAVVP